MKLTSNYSMLKLTDITLEQLEQTVRELAREYPDTVYQHPSAGFGCCYITGKAGPGNGCIIGQALQRLGCEFTDQLECVVTSLFKELNNQYNVWVRFVQYGQDHGLTWGRAVEIADKFNTMKEVCDEIDKQV